MSVWLSVRTCQSVGLHLGAAEAATNVPQAHEGLLAFGESRPTLHRFVFIREIRGQTNCFDQNRSVQVPLMEASPWVGRNWSLVVS